MKIQNYNLICPMLEGKKQVKLWLKQMQKFAEVLEEMNTHDLQAIEKEEQKIYNPIIKENEPHKNSQ